MKLATREEVTALGIDAPRDLDGVYIVGKGTLVRLAADGKWQHWGVTSGARWSNYGYGGYSSLETYGWSEVHPLNQRSTWLEIKAALEVGE